MTAVGDWVDWQALVAPPATFVEALRAHKPALLALLRGDRCRYCGSAVDWHRPNNVAFVDRTGAHLECYERTAAARPARDGTPGSWPPAWGACRGQRTASSGMQVRDADGRTSRRLNVSQAISAKLGAT